MVCLTTVRDQLFPVDRALIMRLTFPWKRVVAGVLFFATLIACGTDFSPYWRIDKLRVMAIKADPIVAKHLEPVTLSALVYAPGNGEVRYDWSWCPVRISGADNYECPISEEEMGEMSAAFIGGDQPEATFVNPLDEDQVREFCEALVRLVLEEVDDPELAGALPVSDCSQGYEISVRLEVSTDDETLVAAKRLTLWGGNEEYNENPRMEAFQIRPEDPADLARLRSEAGWTIPAGADHDDQWVDVPEDEDMRVLTDVTFEMRGVVDPESVLMYTPGVPHGQESQPRPEPREEALVFRYFSTTGTIQDPRRLYAPPQNTLEEAPIATLTISESQVDEQCQEIEDDGCGVRVWSIVRDGRLGVDWVERRLLVVQ